MKDIEKLIANIEVLRKQLNQLVDSEQSFTNRKIIQISHRLDFLLNQYYKAQSKRKKQ